MLVRTHRPMDANVGRENRFSLPPWLKNFPSCPSCPRPHRAFSRIEEHLSNALLAEGHLRDQGSGQLGELGELSRHGAARNEKFLR